FLQAGKDGLVLRFNRFQVVFLRCSLELPLVLEQSSQIDVTEDLAQVEIADDFRAPEWRLGDIGRRRNYDCRRLRRAAWLGSSSRCCGSLGGFLYPAAFRQALTACT